MAADTEPVYFPSASGLCAMCDSRFRDQPALGWRHDKVAGGWLLAETACVAIDDGDQEASLTPGDLAS